MTRIEIIKRISEDIDGDLNIIKILILYQAIRKRIKRVAIEYRKDLKRMFDK